MANIYSHHYHMIFIDHLDKKIEKKPHVIPKMMFGYQFEILFNLKTNFDI